MHLDTQNLAMYRGNFKQGNKTMAVGTLSANCFFIYLFMVLMTFSASQTAGVEEWDD